MLAAGLMLLLCAEMPPFPPSAATLPASKVKVELDPLLYRSASQGPIMPTELEPATLEDLENIDTVIHRATRTHGWQPVIPQFSKGGQWAWQQWEGTIFQRLWKNAFFNMLPPTMLLCAAKILDPSISWWKIPKDHAMAPPFLAISNGWNYILTLATFVTTFFVGHSHDFWRRSYALSRSVQGRLNDIGLLVSSHIRREPDGELGADARDFLEANARNLRLLHCLFYADLCYRKTLRAGSQVSIASIRLLLSFDRVSRTAPGLTRTRPTSAAATLSVHLLTRSSRSPLPQGCLTEAL